MATVIFNKQEKNQIAFAAKSIFNEHFSCTAEFNKVNIEGMAAPLLRMDDGINKKIENSIRHRAENFDDNFADVHTEIRKGRDGVNVTVRLCKLIESYNSDELENEMYHALEALFDIDYGGENFIELVRGEHFQFKGMCVIMISTEVFAAIDGNHMQIHVTILPAKQNQGNKLITLITENAMAAINAQLKSFSIVPQTYKKILSYGLPTIEDNVVAQLSELVAGHKELEAEENGPVSLGTLIKAEQARNKDDESIIGEVEKTALEERIDNAMFYVDEHKRQIDITYDETNEIVDRLIQHEFERAIESAKKRICAALDVIASTQVSERKLLSDLLEATSHEDEVSTS